MADKDAFLVFIRLLRFPDSRQHQFHGDVSLEDVHQHKTRE